MKRGIVLMNLGSPESTSVKDVKKFLDEFLMDKRVIDSNWLLRFFLVRLLITPFRASQSAHAYRSVWTEAGSPLMVISKQLQEALQQELPEPVEISMRYGEPSCENAFDRLSNKIPGLEEVVVLPLYPHYAKKIHKKKQIQFQTFHHCAVL